MLRTPRLFVVALALLSLVASAVLADRAAADVTQARLVISQTSRLSSQIAGERAVAVRELLVREGDRVKKGDVLARLNVETLMASRSVAERAVEQAETAVDVSRSELAGAKLQYDRLVKLETSAAFRRATLEDAEIALRTAESKLKRAESDVRLRRAELASIEVEIRQSEIVAPFDAVVLTIAASPGASVTPANPDIVTLLDLSRVELELTIPAGAAARFAPGKKIAYSLGDSRRLDGEVRALLPAAASGDYLVRVKINPADLPPVFNEKTRVMIHQTS